MAKERKRWPEERRKKQEEVGLLDVAEVFTTTVPLGRGRETSHLSSQRLKGRQHMIIRSIGHLKRLEGINLPKLHLLLSLQAVNSLLSLLGLIILSV